MTCELVLLYAMCVAFVMATATKTTTTTAMQFIQLSLTLFFFIFKSENFFFPNFVVFIFNTIGPEVHTLLRPHFKFWLWRGFVWTFFNYASIMDGLAISHCHT